eukprot:CAMPEP_0115363880 /NCGR_PEP_ID=MMETSP0270-20121206/103469_1 /TAXON_ID=71861 /ORGANISM="Scrippsiella trochoidea, Strain CCMP3099" /LENGTH=91 /DNA_ID=CAMNT_0002786537 /DNA_START=263 /DNA_END=538 /DNA_ORIENTATION=-
MNLVLRSELSAFMLNVGHARLSLAALPARAGLCRGGAIGVVRRGRENPGDRDITTITPTNWWRLAPVGEAEGEGVALLILAKAKSLAAPGS